VIISPVIEGYLVKRYKRFFADILLKDSQEVVIAHCPNPGAMLGLLEANSPVLLSPSTNPKRKLGYTLQAIQVNNIWVGVNTALPNELVAVALANNSISQLEGYSTIQREVKYGLNSRVDFLLTAPDKPNCYVEVKNVHLKRFEAAEFPDCVTARGAKHLQELSISAEQGQRCIMLYVVQRDDCKGFQIASDLDPAYAKAAEIATTKGVETIGLTYSLNLTDNQLAINQGRQAQASTRTASAS
jgi:sugar fermentation stimulation protein A